MTQTKDSTSSKTFVITFDRIGRSHQVPPLTAEAKDADHLAEQIYRYARPHLRSIDIEVAVDIDEGKGSIFCGFNNGGTFTIAEAVD